MKVVISCVMKVIISIVTCVLFAVVVFSDVNFYFDTTRGEDSGKMLVLNEETYAQIVTLSAAYQKSTEVVLEITSNYRLLRKELEALPETVTSSEDFLLLAKGLEVLKMEIRSLVETRNKIIDIHKTFLSSYSNLEAFQGRPDYPRVKFEKIEFIE